MANYYGTTRTNYFAVTDPDRLKHIIEKVVGAEDTVCLFDCTVGGVTKYGFGCYSTISGYPAEDEEDDYDYDAFVDDLQDVLAPGDAIAITEVGHEKLRYLYAATQIITKDTIESLDHYGDVSEKLCEMMGDDSYRTTFDY